MFLCVKKNSQTIFAESPTSSKIYYEIGTEKTAPSTNDILCLDGLFF